MSKMKKRTKRRVDRRALNEPINLEVNEEDLTITKEKKYPIVEKIDSDNDKDRLWAIGSLSRLIVEDMKVFELVLKTDAVTRIIKRLCDNEIGVKIASAGALRNIIAIGSSEVCDMLIKKDCLTPFFSILATYNPELKKEKTICQLYVHTLATLASLSEGSDLATNMIVNSDIKNKLVTMISSNSLGSRVSSYAAELLCVLSDENDVLINKFTKEEFSALESVMKDKKYTFLIRTLCSSILFNICPQKELTKFTEAFTILFKSIPQFDPNAILPLMLNHKDALEKIANSDKNVVQSFPKQLWKQIKEWRDNLDTYSLAMEMFTNLSATSELNIPGEDFVSPLHPSIVKYILQSLSTEKIIYYSKYLNDQLNQLFVIPDIKDQLGAHTRLQICSLSCLNNILLNFELKDINNIKAIWIELANITVEAIRQVNVEILELVTSAMWTILRRCQELPDSDMKVVEMLFNLAKLDQSEVVRSNVIGIMGSLSRSQVLPSIVGDIGKLFIDSLKDNSPWVIAETLNGFMDIFAETDFNEIVTKLNMMNALISFVPVLQDLIKKSINSKTDENLMNRLDETESNLIRFIEYKQSQF